MPGAMLSVGAAEVIGAVTVLHWQHNTAWHGGQQLVAL